MFKISSKHVLLLFAIFFSANAAQASCTATSNSDIAARIGAGHAYQKHVVDQREFEVGKVMAGLAMPSSPTVNSVSSFQSHILNVMGSSSNKSLYSGRKAWWYATTGTIVIHDPANVDCGTAFRPTNGKSYFDSVS